MKKTKQSIRIEGVSLNPVVVAGMTKEQWMKHGKEAGYFALVGNSTPNPQQWEAVMTRAHEEAHKAAGTTATPAAKTPDKEK